jgi:hypothetical protein
MGQEAIFIKLQFQARSKKIGLFEPLSEPSSLTPVVRFHLSSLGTTQLETSSKEV